MITNAPFIITVLKLTFTTVHGHLMSHCQERLYRLQKYCQLQKAKSMWLAYWLLHHGSKFLTFYPPWQKQAYVARWRIRQTANIMHWGVEIQFWFCVKSQHWDVICTTHELQNLLQCQVTLSFCSNTQVMWLSQIIRAMIDLEQKWEWARNLLLKDWDLLLH